MTTREELEREVSEIIREHVAIGYEFSPDGSINPETLCLSAEGAAHLIVHKLVKAAPVEAGRFDEE